MLANLLPNFLVENLCTAARHTAQAGFNQLLGMGAFTRRRAAKDERNRTQFRIFIRSDGVILRPRGPIFVRAGEVSWLKRYAPETPSRRYCHQWSLLRIRHSQLRGQRRDYTGLPCSNALARRYRAGRGGASFTGFHQRLVSPFYSCVCAIGGCERLAEFSGSNGNR